MVMTGGWCKWHCFTRIKQNGFHPVHPTKIDNSRF